MSVTLIGLDILHGSICKQQSEDAYQALMSEAMLRLRNAAAMQQELQKWKPIRSMPIPANEPGLLAMGNQYQ